MSLRDLIWLRAARNQDWKNKNELEKAKLDLEIFFEKQRRLLLCDLRSIMFATLSFGENQLAADRAWYSLPSMVENGVKAPKTAQGKSRGVREAEKEAEKQESKN